MTDYLRMRIREAQRRYRNGDSMGRVAQAMGVSRARVHQWLVLGERAGLGRVVRDRIVDRRDLVHEGLRTATSWQALRRALGYRSPMAVYLVQRWTEKAGYAHAQVLLRFAENKDRAILDALWAQCVRLGTPEVNTTVLQRDPVGVRYERAARKRFGSIQQVRALLAARKKATRGT